jgi:uncharacterized protein
MQVGTVTLHSRPRPGSPSTLVLAATLYLPGPAQSAARPKSALPSGLRGAPGLVVGHGADSRRQRHDEFCREACAQGFAVLALDFRGHGESAGAVDGPLEEDVLAAARFLRDHPSVDGRHLCYRGSSMGGFYGLKAASLPAAGFRSLALLCPASEQVILGAIRGSEERRDKGGGDAAQPAGPTRWDVPRLAAYFRTQDSLALAARVGCPVLLVHARGDAVVPFDHSLALARHLAGDTTLVALADGSHTSAQHDPAIHRQTAAWLLAQVKSACTGRT